MREEDWKMKQKRGGKEGAEDTKKKREEYLVKKL